MKKHILIGVIVIVLAAAGMWWIYNQRSGQQDGCIQIKSGKFAAWPSKEKIPHGDLRRIAGKYLKGDAQENGAIVGGFFKAIDTYPDTSSAKYYQRKMKAWAESSEGLPYWSVMTGELLCA